MDIDSDSDGFDLESDESDDSDDGSFGESGSGMEDTLPSNLEENSFYPESNEISDDLSNSDEMSDPGEKIDSPEDISDDE